MATEKPSPAKPVFAPIRRVVTGHDTKNVAKVLIDAPATNHKHKPGSGTVGTLLWVTDTMPAEMPVGEDAEDTGAMILGTPPPPNGTRFAIIDYMPGNDTEMHRTETIDYIVCISGQIDMEMDDSTVTLKAGDVLVQRGTNHRWLNRGPGPARLAFVLIDAEPLGIGHPRLRPGAS
jgi:quercetin dioxygenase-like cupin family protein